MKHLHKYFCSTLILFLVVGFAASNAFAQDGDITGEDLEGLLPETLGSTTLQEANPHSEARVAGVYADEEAGVQMRVVLGFGAIVDEVMPGLSSMQMMGATEADDWHAEEWSIDGQTVNYMRVDGNGVAFSLVDQFFLLVMAEGVDDPDVLRSAMEDFDFGQLAEWEAPGEYTTHSLSPEVCLTIDCFADRVASCEAGQMGGELGRNLGGLYTVEEPTDDGQCLLSFMFTANPNDELIDKKMFFPVSTDADVKGNFQEDVMGPMEECMDGESDSDHCSGPLLDMMQ